MLAAAVLALVVREVWQLIRDRREGRQRDRLILTAVAREVFVVRATADAIIKDINRERMILAEKAKWRLKPLLRLPTSIYDVLRERIPKALLEEDDGLAQVIALQAQCDFMNKLAEEQQRWKSPAARGQEDQLEVIVQFHGPLGETISSIAERCGHLLSTLERAGEKVGGLDVKRVQEPTQAPA